MLRPVRAAEAFALPVERVAGRELVAGHGGEARAHFVRQQHRAAIAKAALCECGKVERRVCRGFRAENVHFLRQLGQVRQAYRPAAHADAHIGRNVLGRDVERCRLGRFHDLREHHDRQMAGRVFVERGKLTQLFHRFHARNRLCQRRDLPQAELRVVRKQAHERRAVDLAFLGGVHRVGDHRAEAAVQLAVRNRKRDVALDDAAGHGGAALIGVSGVRTEVRLDDLHRPDALRREGHNVYDISLICME